MQHVFPYVQSLHKLKEMLLLSPSSLLLAFLGQHHHTGVQHDTHLLGLLLLGPCGVHRELVPAHHVPVEQDLMGTAPQTGQNCGIVNSTEDTNDRLHCLLNIHYYH